MDDPKLLHADSSEMPALLGVERLCQPSTKTNVNDLGESTQKHKNKETSRMTRNKTTRTRKKQQEIRSNEKTGELLITVTTKLLRIWRSVPMIPFRVATIP